MDSQLGHVHPDRLRYQIQSKYTPQVNARSYQLPSSHGPLFFIDLRKRMELPIHHLHVQCPKKNQKKQEATIIIMIHNSLVLRGCALLLSSGCSSVNTQRQKFLGSQMFHTSFWFGELATSSKIG